MKLKVEMFWESGILPDGVIDERSDPVYELIDADTGRTFYQGSFSSPLQLEEFIAERYPQSERWMPPPASAEEAKKLDHILHLLDDGTIAGNGPRVYLIGTLYRSGHAPETAARIRAALARLG